MSAVDRRRWLMPGGPTPAHRRPLLAREHSAPAVLERAREVLHDTYASLPKPPPRESLVDRAQARLFRLTLKAAWFWVRCCWRRR